jgi:sec-independent protein translocase protein TatA
MEWGVVAAVAAGVALLFGVKKIPEFARNIGRAQGEFKKGLREGVVDEEPAATTTPAPAPAPTPAPSPAPAADIPPPPPPPPAS